MSGRELQVLVVDDEALTADAHAELVRRVPGFAVAGVVYGGADALRHVRDRAPDLVLLDFNLPDLHGLDVCRALRGAGTRVDVIAVTSTRDLAAVRSAVSLGVVSYLLKPFAFASLRDKLERYADYRQRLHEDLAAGAQTEIDRAFAALRGFDPANLPGGLAAETLDRVAAAVRAAPQCSATEIAATCGVSRVTARRYLEHLADTNVVTRTPRHRGAGRPEIEYRWRDGR
ncbi:Response regulator of citrate/malate metabolism [Jatrophihabitans endophyticus]|uniref:Transcriptional regulatory protein n=1 Tax=Jatrophihabitans endophyticus TaxID=1206085 RepID=A0A1M5BUZ9_9ACTN|nr:response regulator [Jatrophihabitans endophyticus]SHF46328.1 Response regulator of citrate/malate metabolism [Jatrophihabitans endophyticus]